MLRVALDRHDVDRFRLIRVHVDHEAEVARQIPAHFLPGVARIVTSQDIPVLLHEQDVWSRRVHRDVVNAVADLSVRVGDVVRPESSVDRLPGRATVVRPKCAGRRDGHEDSLGILRVLDDRVQTQAAASGLPLRPGAVAAQPRDLLPVLTPVGGAEERGVLDAGVHRVRVRQ